MEIVVPAYYENKDGSFSLFEKLDEAKQQKIIERATKQALKKQAKEAAKAKCKP